MYTATLTGKEENGRNINYTVNYNDGVKPFQEIYTIPAGVDSEDLLKANVKRKIDYLNADIVPTVVVGEEISLVPADVDKTAREKWGEEVLQLEYLVHLQTLGVIPADNAELVAQRAKVINELRPKFLK